MKKIIKLLENINEQGFGDIVKSGLARTASNVAGGLVTGLARASGIPFLAGASDVLGKSASDLVNHYLNPQDLQRKLETNYYFYNDEHFKYQAGNYGYDLDLPREKFNPRDITTIRTLIAPAFDSYGFKSKFIEKRDQSKMFFLLLFRKGSNLPSRDSRRNPMIYVIPYSLFDMMKDEQTSKDIVKELLKTYGLLK